jgi:hypothetical protein
VQGQGEGQANRGQQDAGRFSVPVRIIEDPIEAERAEQRAERAEKREADDLITQQRSAAAAERGADAAESQKAATWLQTSLAAVGTAALLYTLWLTRRSVEAANRAARAAEVSVKLARETAVAQLRAYVFTGVVQGALPPDPIGPFSVKVELRNSGPTPAYNVRPWLVVFIGGYPDPGEPFEGPAADFQSTTAILPPGGHVQLYGHTGESLLPSMPGLKASTSAAYVYGEIHYKDVFGHDRWTKFRLVCVGGNFGKGSFQLTRDGNEAS